MWQELGIAPTADAREIRRAYASLLKSIDPDRDRDAFQRLREAYETALAWARGAEKRPGRAERAHPGGAARMPVQRPAAPADRPAGPARPAPIDIEVDQGETAALLHAFRTALARGATAAAFAHLTTASAKGLVSLAEEEEVFVELMSFALVDDGLSFEQFRAMARHSHWDIAMRRERGSDKPLRPELLRQIETDERFRRLTSEADWPLRSAALREMVATRLAAERWYESLLAASKQRFWGRGRDEARVLLSPSTGQMLRRRFLSLIRADRRSMRQLVAQYDLYRPWLDRRVDPKLLALLRDFYGRGLWRALPLRVAVGFGAFFLPIAAVLLVSAMGAAVVFLVEFLRFGHLP